mmetsp:Transcript_37683/g.59600  ORF Transcript_37683/g.59600 Transcript_37683/m.59600 type:complete len:186 (+) Transcript_37683:41-598(+)
MRAWGSNDQGKSPPRREEEMEAASQNGKRTLEQMGSEVSGRRQRGRGVKTGSDLELSSSDLDGELRAFFDGKAKEKGLPVNKEEDEKKALRAKRFGMPEKSAATVSKHDEKAETNLEKVKEGDSEKSVATVLKHTENAEPSLDKAKEIELKVARAKRFGLLTPEMDDAQKKLDRAKRFSTEAKKA